jgi:hypothetical protein
VGPTHQWLLQPPTIYLLPRSLSPQVGPSHDRRPRLGARPTLSRGLVGRRPPSSSSLHHLRRQVPRPAATIAAIVPCFGRPQISSCRPIPCPPLRGPCFCSPTQADPGAGHCAAGHALPRREVASHHAGGCAPHVGMLRATGRWGSPQHHCRQPALPIRPHWGRGWPPGLAAAPSPAVRPCPFGRLKPLGGRGRPEVQQPTRAVAATNPAPPGSATHAPAASVPAPLGPSGSRALRGKVEDKGK